jgi:hypothetical protein
MIAPSSSSDRTEARQSGEEEARDAIEELIAEFGIKCVVSAVLNSTAGASLPGANHADQMRAVNYILCHIIDAGNPRLEADIMALGAGTLLRQGVSMRDVAVKYGVTVADISKQVVAFVKKNGLPPSHCMRSEKDRKTYALTNRSRI